MTHTPTPSGGLSIEELPWPGDVEPPPTDLPYDDGEPMESPWHAASGPLLKASYVAAHGGRMTDYYVGVNMFVYYSWQQVRNKDYKGPDLYFVKNVDGIRDRLYWAIWNEEGRYPDVIVELLSEATERDDLGTKKRLYEEVFRTTEYFCIAPQVKRLLGWRLTDGRYKPIKPNDGGRLWSKELDLWFGPWRGIYLGEEHIWPRFFTPDGDLVLLPEEAERQRADDLAARLAQLEAELRALRGEELRP
jgi:Uma2 family endonuclease